MQVWKFTFDGMTGQAELYRNGVCFIHWAGMGFHIEAASLALWKAIWAAQPR